MKLVFATHNAHKLTEIRHLLAGRAEVLGLHDINCAAEIPETATTLEGNALLKARYVKEHYQLDCFSDDSGLEVDALNGAPGVHSARYAGEQKNDAQNMEKLLATLGNTTHRDAQFRTVIALVLNGKEYLFEGIIRGSIGTAKRGANGFGYDPLFTPQGHAQTFAEMDLATKNAMSHRAIAIHKLMTFLATLPPL